MASNIVAQKNVHVGTGAPSTSDALSNTTFYPIDSVYIDKSTGTSYVRNAVTKAASDWQANSGSGGSGGGTILQSPDNTLWQVQINDAGVLVTAQVTSGTAGTLHLFSPDNTEWNVTVNNSGALETAAI